MSEYMEYDLAIIGAGPAGLAAAIRYAQLCQKNNKIPKVCVLEKGASIGAHILSGAVFEPSALTDLIPDWHALGAPLRTPVKQDTFTYLTHNKAWPLPTPKTLKNKGNYIISLGELCQWLGKQAESLGVDLFPGFCAAEILFSEKQTPSEIVGVRTGAMGIDKQGAKLPSYQPGVDILAKQTLFAEGCRGSLSQQLIKKFNLDEHSAPQIYGLGIKELWEINPDHHVPGKVNHTIGWPLDNSTYGGGFIYHLDKNLISIGLIIGLDYQNPYLDPYQLFQQFKHHPKIQSLLTGGRCLKYGARAINEGGLQSIPKLTFPGGALIGCSAGFVNVGKIKGSHNAMKSGMAAAEAVFELFKLNKDDKAELKAYPQKLQKTSVYKELYQVRNLKPGFKWGMITGLLYAALDQYLFRGRAPWTFSHKADYIQLKDKNKFKPISYQKPDGQISFDKLTSVSRSNTYHEENQPCHLKLKNPTIAIQVNYQKYASPETRYCPAGVYEMIEQDKSLYLQINAQNCIHCKTCDIKDPTQNIVWVPPEGGGGPNYGNM
jgi:electron-transferring-flavoprotein dehydrogenase